MVLVFCLMALWIIVGPPALMLSHTRRFDLTLGDAAFCTVLGAIMGPVAWFILWIEGKSFGSGIVIAKKRKL